MIQINQSKLEFFTAAALTGLLSNPEMTSLARQQYLRAKKMTLEGLAVKSAIETMEILERMHAALDKEEKEATVTSITGGIDGIDQKSNTECSDTLQGS
jgi:hypothetical protein